MESFVPWIAWEQIDIPATGLQQSDPEEFRNSTDDDIWIDRILFDANSSTETFARFGKHGKVSYIDTYSDLRALHNVLVMDETTDCGFPLLKLRKPVIVPPKSIMTVEIRDTGNDADTIHVGIVGYKANSKELYIMNDALTLTANGSGAIRLSNDFDEPLVITDVCVTMEDTGTAARMRARKVHITGGGMPDWSSSYVPMSLHFPDRNGVSYIWSPPGPLVLHPGEALSSEFRNTSGSTQTVYWSAIGYRKDRRP
jgi:hypothetical protein